MVAIPYKSIFDLIPIIEILMLTHWSMLCILPLHNFPLYIDSINDTISEL